MSKNITAGFKAHLGQEVTTLACCWKLSLRDGTVYGYTNLDVDLFFQSVLYSASSGSIDTNISSSLDMTASTIESYGLLDNVTITEEDLLAGRFDGAQIELFLVNYMNLTQGKMMLMTGEIGRITIENGKFTAQIEDLMTYLDHTILEVYSYHCRVKTFADERCKLNIADYTFVGNHVTEVIGENMFETDIDMDNKMFTYGHLVWTTGANVGLTSDVKTYENDRASSPAYNGVMTLFQNAPYAVQVGDTFTAVAGCDRTPETCKARGNFVNYRGEPFIKGIDKLYSYYPTNPEGIQD